MDHYVVIGQVKEVGEPVSRRVFAYKADKADFNTLGELLGKSVSQPSGAYVVSTGVYTGPVFVVALDDEVAPDYDPGAIDWVLPQVAPGRSTYYTRILADLAAAYWKLDDTAPTAIAIEEISAQTGTYENSPTLEVADTPYGGAGFSVAFNGSDQALVTPSVLSPLAGADFSIELVFKTSTSTTQTIFVSRAFSGAADNSIWVVLNVPVTGGLFIALNDGAVANNIFSSNLGLADGAWHHLVITKQGQDLTVVYDGGKVAMTGAVTVTGPLHDGSVHLFARAPDAAPAEGFSGLLYQLPLWISALSEETAKVHFFLLRRPAQPYSDRVLLDYPIRFWGFEEVSGDTVALDLAGLDVHGNYVGAAPGGPALISEEPISDSAVFALAADRVEVELPFNETDPVTEFTFECWFVTTLQTRAYVLDRENTSNRLAIVLNEDGTGAENAGFLECYISPGAGIYYRVATSGAHAELYDGASHHLAVIYSHPNITIMLDGVELAVTGVIDNPTVLWVNGEWAYIGAVAGLGGEGFIGQMSKVAMWVSALTPAQIQNHYSGV